MPLRPRRSRLLRLPPVEGGGHPYLVGPFAPVPVERVVKGPFEVTGTLPPDLEGTFLINGPNPATIGHPALYRWCTGDGMVHAVTFRRGRALTYRNRWVRTRSLAAQIDVLAPRGPTEVVDSPANANVVFHAGKLLALAEAGLPHRLSARLDTVATDDFGGLLTSPVSPLPKTDRRTGSLTFVGYDSFGPPFLFVYELDDLGALRWATEVPTERPAMHHDFGLTETFVVLLDLPVFYDHERQRQAGPPFRFAPEVGGRVGLLRRGADGSTTTWVEVDPGAVFHVVNAFDHGDGVVVFVCRYAEAFGSTDPAAPGGPDPVLERWEVDPQEPSVKRQVVEERPLEWPVVDPGHAGRPHRRSWFAEPASRWAASQTGRLLLHDAHTGAVEVFDPGPGKVAGPPTFVGAPGSHRAEGDGWLLSILHDAAGGRSDLVVLDATSLQGPPQAVVHLPVAVPAGLHGSFVPAGLL